MTYEQYQQIYSLAKTQIETRVNKLQPRAGNNASVNGMGISIEVPMEGEREAIDSWEFLLIGRIAGERVKGREITPYDSGKRFIASVSRDTLQVVNGPIFTDIGYQLFNDPEEEGEPASSNSFTLTLESSSMAGTTSMADYLFYGYPLPQYDKTTFPELGFKVRVKVVIEMYSYDRSGEPIVYSETTMEVGYEGESHFFYAPLDESEEDLDPFYFLRIKSIERTA